MSCVGVCRVSESRRYPTALHSSYRGVCRVSKSVQIVSQSLVVCRVSECLVLVCVGCQKVLSTPLRCIVSWCL